MLRSTIFAFGLVFLFVTSSHSQQVSPSVRISAGAVNGVFIERNGETLAVYGDPNMELKNAGLVLFTHFRRDVIWAGRELVNKGALAVVPRAERSYFTKGDSVWMKFAASQYREHSNHTTKVGMLPVNVHREVAGGETFEWQDIEIKVLNTSGYTAGSVSYAADIDNKRFVFTGDLIYGDGMLFDLYSFQDALPGGIDGNHGYAARLGQLLQSLQRVKDLKPDFLIPARGPIISDPDLAIEKLTQRIRALYLNYLSITAQRWNHTDRMLILSNHVLGAPNVVKWMPFSEVIRNDPPSWYSHINCSKLVWAEDSSAFLIDCGTRNDLNAVRKLKESGRLKSLDGIFVTHYHYDHTDFVSDAAKEFGCPVYVTEELADILKNPSAFHMPSLTANPISQLTVMREGQKMPWKDFMLTFFFFPGQTLYHDAILFQKTGGESIFFVGDSFSPAGVDDYCFQNRNILHEGTGYLYCLDVLKKLPPNTLLSNQHLKPVFAFSQEQLNYMKDVLHERNGILAELLPWDDVNYGTDDQWVRIYPYGQTVKAGKSLDYRVKVINYSDQTNTFTLTPQVPAGFRVEPAHASVTIEPRQEGEFTFKVRAPKKPAASFALLLVDIKFDEWELKEWAEAKIEIAQ